MPLRVPDEQAAREWARGARQSKRNGLTRSQRATIKARLRAYDDCELEEIIELIVEELRERKRKSPS